MLAVLLVGCFKPLPDPIPEVEEPATASFAGEVHIDESVRELDSTNLNNSSVIVYIGNGGSNLFPSFTLTLTHFENLSETGHFSIVDGKFSLTDGDGNSVSGTYTGSGTKPGLRMTHQWVVTSAVGKYDNHDGTFTAVFADDENDGSFRGQIFGVLQERMDDSGD